MKTTCESENGSPLGSIHDTGNLTGISHEGVNKVLRPANRRYSSRKKEKNENVRQNDPKTNEQEIVHTMVAENASMAEDCIRDAVGTSRLEVDVENHQDTLFDDSEDMNDSDWEDGSIPKLDPVDHSPTEHVKGLTIEFDEPSGSAGRKPVHRASAEDKELAELVHKVHLLCLVARGRLIDNACDDPLIQASLLSLLPIHLSKISEVSNVTANALSPLVTWFHNNFHVRSLVRAERSFPNALAFALETREGTSEEIAALSVALFRALKFTARFVSILDVASVKPEADKYESSSQEAKRVGGGIFSTSTLMVANPKEISIPSSHVKSSSCHEKADHSENSLRSSHKNKGGCSTCSDTQSRYSTAANELTDATSTCQVQSDTSGQCRPTKSQGLRRKGDLEFEMQLAMAISATTVGTHENISGSSDLKILNGNNSLEASTPTKRWKRIERVESSTCSPELSTALGSRKIGSPLFWAEVYCGGENLTGKWVHVDVVNAIIDGEQKVEDAAAACKTSLRYVVAFAGRGAKDVTRRYCVKWYKIAPKRVNSVWWDSVLAPLRELESGATGGVINFDKLHDNASNEQEKIKVSRMSEYPGADSPSNHVILPKKSGQEASKEYGSKIEVESSLKDSFVATRNSLEDMELETRALTEPLPTNQQAYKNHALYALERWLTKYQILNPRGPILGYCSGHPVYPRTCVQTLKARERWLREGLQVKGNEIPAKVLKRSAKLKKVQVSEEDDYDENDSKGTIELYGKWQLEPLCLPHAVDGILPKNERGQVDVWSEKCLPPGTVHLRLPRVYAVAKRLEIDYAPAMVGFEFRNGRAAPVFDGIVVCTEFKDAILEAYAEEEERRVAEEKKRKEAQAISRWYQLLSSIITRQKLNSYYGDGSSSQPSRDVQDKNNEINATVESSKGDRQSTGLQKGDMGDTMYKEVEHEHVFLIENESFDAENSLLTKRCRCGFSIQVEEL
ncbi:DNA repair protein RAD4 isoform X2 [Durio zibethinus]|uniref:DNA repair protein RAD4 isoform X2 n=1 Tax=Durio zibethinus TaxID=66656 RepID=A0A6P6A334_DURZI|nr:DNA repair protein RAD4 isoform X2 [Durio zibethinus]XP_022759205.1 DNA repair protein RAD4 isoform X2 [Durio zibethinus]